MNSAIAEAFTQAGAFAAIGFAAMGSALGTGAGGAAAIGAWKKCYAQDRPAPFQLTVFAGAPLSQTIYGLVLMIVMSGKVATSATAYWPAYLMIGITGGIAMGMSAWMQGRAAAGACDAFAETGKGFTNFLIALGIIETVAIFVLALSDRKSVV